VIFSMLIRSVFFVATGGMVVLSSIGSCLAQAAEASALPASAMPSFAEVALQSLMKDTINPAALKLWRAVSYEVSTEGSKETKPTTAEDWAQLRAQTEQLISAGFALRAPTLTLAPSTNSVPAFQYSPSEITELLQQNNRPWRNYAEQMQATLLQLLTSIEQRNIDSFTEQGAVLNQSCEGCHAQYWYKPLPMRGNEAQR
jgi:hypothetical protein